MDRALAVVEADETTKALVSEAGELAAGVDAELLLLHVTSQEEYDDRREDFERISELDSQYTLDKALEGARQFAEDIGHEVLGDIDVDFEASGRVGEKGDEVLAVAEEAGCDHIFVAGRKRSPAGKAVFGDVTQRIILEFDGAVTVVTT